VASLVGAAVATWRVVEGFGTGAKGQDAAFVIALCLAGVAMGIGSAVTGAMILADKRPEFAAWLRARPVLGSVLTLAVAAPLGLGIVVIAMFTLGFLASLVGALRK
jgi:heme O synthase-like polyprenyltransferase